MSLSPLEAHCLVEIVKRHERENRELLDATKRTAESFLKLAGALDAALTRIEDLERMQEMRLAPRPSIN